MRCPSLLQPSVTFLILHVLPEVCQPLRKHLTVARRSESRKEGAWPGTEHAEAEYQQADDQGDDEIVLELIQRYVSQHQPAASEYIQKALAEADRSKTKT